MSSSDSIPGSLGFTPATETKFHRDGSLRYCPGNTVISMVPPGSPIADWLADTVERFRRCPAAELYSFLPASSWHMTVFELLLDGKRVEPLWSRFLPLDAPIRATDTFLAAAVAGVIAPVRMTMHPTHVAVGDGITLWLQPADQATTTALVRYRERLSEVTGIRPPDFAGYGFHITLAYAIHYPDALAAAQLGATATAAEKRLDQVGRFDLPAPSIRFFNDMGAFPTERPQ